MKKIFAILAFCSLLFFTKTQAQYVTIPDANFVWWLNLNGFSSALNGNQLDTTNALVINDTSLFISGIGISNLYGIQYFKKLTRLDIRSGGALYSLPTLPNSLIYLNCASNLLGSLPSLPNSLKYLYCCCNQLNSLPALPNSLIYLDCSDNHLSTLPTLPNSLTQLECIYNQLISLPTLPSSLTKLECYTNLLSSLPTLPNSLTWLDCHSNLLSSLPTLPNSLTWLDCHSNLLSSLPTLPNSLTNLYCNNNQLNSLPTILTVVTLFCSHNYLTSLPVIPWQTLYIDCSHNQLNSLPTNLTNIYTLNCSYNFLTSLPNFSNVLNELDCSHNQLTSLATLPDILTTLHCDSNQLVCLPDLKIVGPYNFSCSGNPLTCLPNYGWNNQLYNAFHAQYPICGIFNPNNCPLYWNISGTVYVDKNSSCTYDAADTVLKNIKVQLWSHGNLVQQTFSRPDGVYTFDVNTYDTFQIRVDTTHLPFYLSCPTQQTLTSIITALDSTDVNMNFAMQCKNISDDVVAQNILTPRQRRGRMITMNITAGLQSIYGFTCTNPNLSGKVKLFKNGAMKFLNNNSYSVAPAVISIDSLIWNVTDFNSFGNNISFTAQVDSQAQIGQSICYTLIVTHNFTDANHSNDTLQLCFPIRNGYDPNEKSGRLNTIDSTITYTVQFQNTGNDTAINIIVRDTLSNDLDVKTLELLNYSFQPFTQTFGNIAVFNFPNINLVDSATNERLSHGFVTFKVKVRTGSTASHILNRAAIYFDLNPAVYTNVSSVLLCYHPTYNSITQTNCVNHPYLFNGHLLSKTGIYLDTLTNHFGCDSFVTLHLNITPTSSKTISQTICSNHPYLFNGKMLSVAGTYYDTLTNYLGCDSLLTLQLTVLQPTNSNITKDLCNGTAYIFHGKIYSASGVYYDTVASSGNCDSIFTITIHQYSNMDTAVMVKNNLLIAHCTSSCSYQWFDCAAQTILSGETHDTLAPKVSGNYALIIGSPTGNCADTSACHFIFVTGLNNIAAKNNRVGLYPNPTESALYLDFEQSYHELHLKLMDSKGQIVQVKNLRNNNKAQVDMSNLAAGIYMLEINADGNFSFSKVMKE